MLWFTFIIGLCVLQCLSGLCIVVLSLGCVQLFLDSVAMFSYLWIVLLFLAISGEHFAYCLLTS